MLMIFVKLSLELSVLSMIIKTAYQVAIRAAAIYRTLEYLRYDGRRTSVSYRHLLLQEVREPP